MLPTFHLTRSQTTKDSLVGRIHPHPTPPHPVPPQAAAGLVNGSRRKNCVHHLTMIRTWPRRNSSRAVHTQLLKHTFIYRETKHATHRFWDSGRRCQSAVELQRVFSFFSVFGYTVKGPRTKGNWERCCRTKDLSTAWLGNNACSFFISLTYLFGHRHVNRTMSKSFFFKCKNENMSFKVERGT